MWTSYLAGEWGLVHLRWFLSYFFVSYHDVGVPCKFCLFICLFVPLFVCVFVCLDLFSKVTGPMQPKLGWWVKIGSTLFYELFLGELPCYWSSLQVCLSRLIFRSTRSYAAQTWWVSKAGMGQLRFCNFVCWVAITYEFFRVMLHMLLRCM